MMFNSDPHSNRHARSTHQIDHRLKPLRCPRSSRVAGLASFTVIATLGLAGCSGSDDAIYAAVPDTGVDAVADTAEPECSLSSSCSEETPWCNEGVCEALPLGYQLGVGDGTRESVEMTEVYRVDQPLEVTDVAFHPERTEEMWVLRRPFWDGEPCTQSNGSGCRLLEGSVTVVSNPNTRDTIEQDLVDPNGWHFLRRPTSFAFSTNGTFATAGEARSGNFLDDTADFMGASLWDSDPTRFGVQPAGGNGSHLDMVHTSPFGMGIENEGANAYWVFNGQIGSLDRIDFVADHGPGQDFHGDAEVTRFVTGELQRLENVPSHMVFDETSRALFVADTGNGRVVRLEVDSGAVGGQGSPVYEELARFDVIEGATLTETVPSGVLTAPSGIALSDDVLFVSDNGEGVLHAFDLEGNLLRSLDTGFPPGTITGITIGPDGNLYFVDQPEGAVFLVEPLLDPPN